MKLGKLIVLEGGDGAGKSTQIKLIESFLKDNEFTFTHLHFPVYGDNEFSDVISGFLRGEYGKSNEVNPYFPATIYAMDQYLYKKRLIELMETYDIVLLDRYVFSNIAYQGAKYENNTMESIDIQEWIYDFQFNFLDMPYPDLSIFLDVPIDVIKERLKIERTGDDREYLKGKSDIHEEDFELQERVRYNYLDKFKSLINCEIIQTAQRSADLGSEYWWVYNPEHIFNSYKHLLKHIVENSTEGDFE